MNFFVSIFYSSRFWFWIVILSIVLGTAAVIGRLADPSGNLSHKIASLWGRWLCQFNGIDVRVHGLNLIKEKKARIFVANHQSYFDIFALSGFVPVQLRWVAKESLFKLPFVGWSMWAAGYIPVDRDNKKKAYLAFMATVEKLKAGCSVVIFPEGTRSPDGNIKEFKKGSHLLSLRSGVPMVPVTLTGTGTIIKKGSGVVHPGKVDIYISPEVEIMKENAKEGEQVLQSIRETICNTYQNKTQTL